MKLQALIVELEEAVKSQPDADVVFEYYTSKGGGSWLSTEVEFGDVRRSDGTSFEVRLVEPIRLREFMESKDQL